MAELYDFQQDGVDWLRNERADPLRAHAAYLADIMGLGKTVQAAVAARDADHVLAIAPASTIPNWRSTWAEWNGGRLAVVSYAKLIRDPQLFEGADWDVVILDEAHYLKSREAQRTLAALDVARRAGRAWLLSGTPMPNDPTELWPPLRILWPEVVDELGVANFRGWMQRFTHWQMTQYGPRPYAIKNAHELRPYLSRLMLRRTVDDVALDLPPIRVDLHRLPNDAALREAIEGLDLDSARLEQMMQQEAVGERSSMARLRRLLGEYKSPKIAQIVDAELEAREYDKIVLLAHHRNVLDRLTKVLEPHGVVGFDGDTPGGARERAVHQFQNDDSVRVFIGQQTAAGIGINLQRAAEVVLVEPAWTPGANAQAIKRVHRIGSKAPVRARIFTLAGSLDEAIMATVRRKITMRKELGI